MKHAYEAALTGSAASLGYNWIYNLPYLEKLAKESDLLFHEPSMEVYKRARKSWFAYPHSSVGDVSVQGEITKWLYHALKEDHGFSRKDYEDLVYEKLKPGGIYQGWVESYAKQLIYNRYTDILKTENSQIRINDDQLVGFAPYIACKANDLSNKKAWDLAQAFTCRPVYREFYEYFDELYEALREGDKQKVLKDYARKAPENYKDLFTLATNTDTKDFVGEHVNTSCYINNTLPLIYHILYRSESFEDALRINTRLGGASMDRGLMLGYLLSAVHEVPSQYKDKVRFEPK